MSDWDASRGNLKDAIVIAGAKGHGGISSYNADAVQAGTYINRGNIIAKRLNVINQFLLSGTTMTFGQYLESRKISLADFLKDLPVDHQFADIDKISLDSSDDKEKITDYAEDLNALYFDQHLGHLDAIESLSADGLDRAVVSGSDPGFFLNVSDKAKARKEKRQEVKDAKAIKKEEKKQIKEDLMNGKITKEEAKNKIKDARKKMQDKVGSGVGREIGKLNHLNPATVIIRNAFLSLLDINAAGMASAFNHIKKANGTHWHKFVKKWEIFGGEELNLKNAINNGIKHKPFPSLKGKKHSAAGDTEELNADDPKNAGKAAAGAASALGGLTATLASNPATAPAAVYVGSGSAVLAVAVPILKSFAKDSGEDTTNIPDIPLPPLNPGTKEGLDAVDAGTDDLGGILDKYKYWILGGLGFLLVFGFLASIGGKKE